MLNFFQCLSFLFLILLSFWKFIHLPQEELDVHFTKFVPQSTFYFIIDLFQLHNSLFIRLNLIKTDPSFKSIKKITAWIKKAMEKPDKLITAMIVWDE